MGHSQTGAINEVNDLLPLLLKGCILQGKYPAFDIKVTLVPVDYVSRAMVHLSGQEKSWGRAFHFFNPGPVEWGRLMAMLRAFGYPLEEVAYDEWWRDLKQQIRTGANSPVDREHLSILMLAMTAPNYLFYKRPAMDASQTEEGLRGSGIACGAIDEALVGNYLNWWQKSGFLPPVCSERPC
jgi:thioester reductase-like protein